MSTQQLFHTAIDFHRSGILDKAESLYQKILATQPKNADVLHLLGLLYHQTGRSLQATKTIQSALHIQPSNPNFLNNLGLAFNACGDHAQAVAAFKQGLQSSPDDNDLQMNLANTLVSQDRFDEAARYYRQILRQNPYEQDAKHGLLHALRGLGNTSQKQGKYIDAEAYFKEAVSLLTSDFSLYYNLGNAQRELGKPIEAAESYRKAVALNPSDADAHNNLGNVLRETGHLTEAIQQYESALKINPRLFHAKVHLIHQKQHICDWTNLNTDIQQVRNWLKSEPQAQISPFAFLAMPNTTAEEQLVCANQWLNNRYKSLIAQQRNQPFKYAAKQKDRLRIGYLSGDFRLHPLAALITDTIELHNREHIECFAYSYARDDKTPERKRLEQAFDEFIDITSLSLEDAAKRIHADQIDILVDLTGFTQSSRTGVVALKPAPISVSWLGFPGSMGSIEEHALFDYLLTDGFITPESQRDCYAETLKPLACYQPNDRKRPLGKPPIRADYGLPEDAFIFCSFNQSFKITPDVFESWMSILKATPESVLWLLESNEEASKNLLKEAEKLGVASNRLYFAPRISMDQHLARHDLADLFLDTAPYNAHTTASDALWMCLPVLTCAGDTFSSRVAGSLLHAVNLPELVVESLNDYEAMAIKLANDAELLSQLRAKLQQPSDQLQLFNTPAFVAQLELAYQEMWQDYIKQ